MYIRRSAIACLVSVQLLAGCVAPVGGDEDGPPPPALDPCDAGYEALRGGAGVHVDPASGNTIGWPGAAYTDVGAALEAGVGDAAQPFADLFDGVAAAHESGASLILLAPGEHALSGATPLGFLGGIDDGLRLVGAGEATVIDASEGSSNMQRGISMTADLLDARLCHFSLRGGLYAIRMEGGTIELPLVLQDVIIEDARGAGLLVSGLNTVARIIDLDVLGVDPSATGPGFGIVIEGNVGGSWGTATGSTELDGIRVLHASTAGIVLDAATARLSGVDVRETRQRSDAFGRGIQIQNDSVAVLDAVVVEDNYDAGLFIHRPLDVQISGSRFARTTESVRTDDGVEVRTGDGLSITGDPAAPTEEHRVTLADNTYEDNGRFGVLVEGVEVVVGTGNVFGGNILPDTTTFPAFPDLDTLYHQGGAEIVGPDGGAPAIDGVGLGGDTGLPLMGMFRDPLDTGAQP